MDFDFQTAGDFLFNYSSGAKHYRQNKPKNKNGSNSDAANRKAVCAIL